jgi:hypothetical protein
MYLLLGERRVFTLKVLAGQRQIRSAIHAKPGIRRVLHADLLPEYVRHLDPLAGEW